MRWPERVDRAQPDSRATTVRKLEEYNDEPGRKLIWDKVRVLES
jgi:hypothetical protein